MRSAFTHFAVVSLLGLLANSAAADPQTKPPAKDVAKQDPNAVETLLENDYVRVLRITLSPFDVLEAHKGEERVIYALSEYEVEFTQGKEKITREWKAGQAHWHPAGEHSIKILGETQARFLVFARKKSKPLKAKAPKQAAGLAGVAPKSAKTILDNDRARATVFKLKPGESLPTYHGLNRAAYALRTYTVRLAEANKPAEVKEREEGAVHWYDAGEYSVENCGEKLAEAIIVEFKK